MHLPVGTAVVTESASAVSAIQQRIRAARLWVGMRMSRWLLSCVILSTLFVLLVSLSFLDLTPLRAVAAEQATIDTLFSAFIGAIITGTAIVVTINQLVLSQELGSAGDQYTRMRDAMEFRRDVEQVLETGVSSPDPAIFLYELLTGIEHRAVALEASVAGHANADLSRDVAVYTTSVVDEAQTVKESLQTAQFGTFAVIWHALDFNYSLWLHHARQLQHAYCESISNDYLDGLIESLTVFAPAREHFKTLYFQWELIALSRALLYIAIPALFVMTGFVLFVDGTTVPGRTLGVDNLVWLVSFGFTVGVAPFVVFTVYILRIVSVAKHTLAMGPIILLEHKHDDVFGTNDP